MARGDIFTLAQLQGNQPEPTQTFSPTLTEPREGDTPLQEPLPQRGTFNQREREDRNIFQRARDFAADVIGGEKLATGAGKALAAPQVQRDLTEAEQQGWELDRQLIQRIQQGKQEGIDTSRLEQAWKLGREQLRQTRGVQEDFIASLPSEREVIGSAVRLGATAAAPVIAGKATAGFTATQPTGIVQGAIQGAKVGAIGGGIEGAAQGVGLGIEAEKDVAGVATSALSGAAGGALLGGLAGSIVGGISGKIAKGRQPDNVLDAVTPGGKDLTQKQYEELVKRGRIDPRSTFEAPRYIMTDGERDVALKYQQIIDDDPIRTAQNIDQTIGNLDDEVGTFLEKNNGIYNKGELKNYLSSQLEDVTDLSSPNLDLLEKKKAQVIQNFVDDIETNNMKSLWQARKSFDADQAIDRAFKGAPSFNKELKIGLRNAVQNYIAERTPEQTYKTFMFDMSNLYNLQDTVAVKAAKERGLSALGAWIKKNPIKASGLTTILPAYLIGRASGEQ